MVLASGMRTLQGIYAMLQLRPNCECCARDLPPESPHAMICSFECTFCLDCAEGVLKGRCPNCGGELVARPRRPPDRLVPNIRSSRDVIVRTEHWPEAVRFYGHVLGFTVSSRAEAMVGFETGAFRLYVEAGPAHAPVFDFLAADVAATKAHLISAGCTLVEEDPNLPRCYLRDPFGVVFNVGRAPGSTG